MKFLFFRKTSLWFSVLLGILFLTVGIVQIRSGSEAGKSSAEGGGLSSVTINQKAEKSDQNSTPSEDEMQIKPSAKKGTSVGEAKPNDYFVEYRLERDRTRSQQVDWFREIVNNQNSGEEARREAQKRLLAITQAVDTEMKIESLLKAQNFKDAVVIINDKSATVIVQVPMLTPADKSKITVIASKITGFSEQNIEIVAKV